MFNFVVYIVLSSILYKGRSAAKFTHTASQSSGGAEGLVA